MPLMSGLFRALLLDMPKRMTEAQRKRWTGKRYLCLAGWRTSGKFRRSHTRGRKIWMIGSSWSI